MQQDETSGAMSEEEEEKQLAEQAQVRRDKLAKLCAEGNDPFVKTSYDAQMRSSEILANFDALEGKEVSIAGRLMSRRIMGKASFSHIQD